jgi:hypothetical protein
MVTIKGQGIVISIIPVLNSKLSLRKKVGILKDRVKKMKISRVTIKSCKDRQQILLPILKTIFYNTLLHMPPCQAQSTREIAPMVLEVVSLRAIIAMFMLALADMDR